MGSKYCAKCGRVTSTNGVPNYCAWGCGSLKEQILLPDYSHWEERLKVIEELKAKYKETEIIFISEEIKPNRVQLKLF